MKVQISRGCDIAGGSCWRLTTVKFLSGQVLPCSISLILVLQPPVYCGPIRSMYSWAIATALLEGSGGALSLMRFRFLVHHRRNRKSPPNTTIPAPILPVVTPTLFVSNVLDSSVPLSGRLFGPPAVPRSQVVVLAMRDAMGTDGENTIPLDGRRVAVVLTS